jgi:hypothetical protein
MLGSRGRKGSKNRTLSFVLGDWNIVSDVTGLVFKASETTETWDNLRVERAQFDPKQPQLEIRARQDKPAVPFSRPDSKPQFYTDITPEDL